jgi:ABC-type nitrate/sulfonate/bicarbonate transport system substrate-binding protein
MSTRTHLTMVTVLAVMAVGIGGYAWVSGHRALQPLGPVEHLTLGTSDRLMTSAVWIAEQQGYFRQEGLEVAIQEFQVGRLALQALLHGAPLDIVTVAPTPLVFQSFSRDDFRIIATFVESQDNHKVIANTESAVATVTDLRGKKIGCPHGTSAHFFLELLLVEHGLAPSQVDVVDMAHIDLHTALAARQVDAIAVWEPHATRVKEFLHDRAIQLSRPGTYRTTFNFVAKQESLHRRRHAVTRFLTAIERANRFIRDRRQEAHTIIADRLQMDKAAVAQILDQFSYKLMLDQVLLHDLENQARWAIKSRLTDYTVVPNYLHFVAVDALQHINPKAVTLVQP